ncbi:MAG: mechanosensitive ion channel domain-containing protein [Bdellovibrionales bacterium]
MEQLKHILLDVLYSSYFSSIMGFMLLILVRHLLIRAVMGLSFKDYERRQKRVTATRNFTFFLLVLIFFLMWGEELKSVAVSLSVVAVAVVLALKELIISFTGGLIKVSSKLFEIGDRVTVKGMRGEIIDHNLFTTTLFEIGPGQYSNQYTGRQIKIPNSVFITDSLVVTPSGNHYTLHVATLSVALDKNIFEKQKILLEAAQAVSAPYMQLAEEYITRMCRKQNVRVPDLKPRVLYETPNPTTVEFHIRMPMPFKALTRTENKVKDMFFAEMFKRGL